MKTSIKKIVAVFGYNNSRIYDVKKIRELAKSKCSAEIMLIKEGITFLDREITPFCLDQKPENPNLATILKEELDRHSLKLIGCLPFSDKGVVGAAHVAREFGLFGDDVATSFAMLDKVAFRELESLIKMDPRKYKKPFYKKVYESRDLFEIFRSHGCFFLKPSSEGNSRGCMKINDENDLTFWIKENSEFLKQGVVCEEYLSSGDEYSFDGVNSCCWITQKFTTQGAFRAEYQHIVPAPLGAKKADEIKETLMPLLYELGSRGGAFHHEFFILDGGRIASVEPNRRPAGMWIWDLAAWSFEGFDPWEHWLDLLCGRAPQPVPLKQRYYSGVRGIISEVDGVLKSVNIKAMMNELTEQFGPENFRLSIMKDEDSILRCAPRDNADFLAYVAIRNPDYEKLILSLDEAEKIIIRHIRVQA